MLKDPALSKQAYKLIGNPENRVCVSSISLWEVNTKRQLGKLDIDGDIVAASISRGIEFASFGVAHASEILALPLHHRDPFDRALLAQARSEGARLVTADNAMRRYAEQVDVCIV
jgi:PIN domain nuclease of toxin-antitoxin system